MNDRCNISRRFWLLVLLGAISLSQAGCDSASSAYTVEFYKAHEAERKQKLAECANDPGGLRNDPLCINAKEAETDAAFGSLRDLPPVGLLDDATPQKGSHAEASSKKDVQGE